jgi:DNA invertase Pin-like site-specific DNA recombinase
LISDAPNRPTKCTHARAGADGHADRVATRLLHQTGRSLPAKLVVAKLDRLSRNTRFLLTLIESGVEVLFADLPEVAGAMGKFILTQMAAVAELEAGLIGERTKAALAAAKQRGVKLGVTGAEILAPKYKAEAKARAEELAPVIREMQRRGYTMRGIAAELTKRKVQTPRGGSWHAQQVKRIVQRLEGDGRR